MAKNILKPYELFLTGQAIQNLRRTVEKSSIRWKPVKELLESLSEFLKDAENFQFISEDASRLVSELNKKYGSEDKSLYSKDSHFVTAYIDVWMGRIKEISKNWLLFYPETHIDATKLNKGIGAFLSDAECNTLEPIEKHGLEEAASSLLFNNFISAEFMALRTAESLLKRWYEKKTSQKLGKTTWGQVLDKLNREYPKEERPKELDLLDYLRERRNEIAHTRGVSNSVQASTTFFNVISLCQTLYLKQD